MQKVEISVIIPTYNEEDNILFCLRSLDKQTTKNFEVILVDDGSKDNTLVKALEFKPKNYKLIVLTQKHDGPALARNLGALKSKGKVLVFLDADMTFDKLFLKNLTSKVILGKSKGTTSIDEFVSNYNNRWAKCWNINEGIINNKRHRQQVVTDHLVFRCILKSEFIKVGGFSKGGYTDDYSLSNKLGYKAEVVKDAIFYHKNPDSLKEVFLQAKWSAKRKYKFGFIGELYALIRANIFFSILLGFYKSVKFKEFSFIFFKIVFDFGITLGMYEYKIFSKGSK